MSASFIDGIECETAAAPMPARRAALLVHAMAAPDRAWLLQRLPASQRAAVLRLLEELDALGVPSQPDLVREVCGATQAPPCNAPRALHEMDTRAVLHVLAAEPDALIAALLRAREDPWSQHLLSSLGDRRVRIERLMHTADGARAPALVAALEEGLARCAAGLERPVEPPKRADRSLRGWAASVLRLPTRTA
jgi:hypothetical protein